jgi:cell cycle sensor histidine kinase DivJ
VDALVHPSARCDALSSARHRAFIAPRLLGSFTALATLPVYLAVRGVPSLLEVIVLAWLLTPILLAYFLSSTGRYESAHVLSSLALTGLITVVAWRTGGIASFAAIWLVVVPLEAALSASRRVVVLGSAVAILAAGLLLLMTIGGHLPQSESFSGALTALGIISAALYAAGIALGAESLSRLSFWMLYAEEDRYRLLARNMTDVISRHGRDGAAHFISPAAERLFGVPVRELLGHGLFSRVHVADRPAYLTALADSAQSGKECSLEFRVRREAADSNSAPGFVWVEMRCRLVDHSVEHTALPGGHEVVAVLRDIGMRKTQEETLEATRAELERANAGKNRFLATMSHELRTPLNAIIGFSDMLTKSGELRLDDARRAEYAKLIHESGAHLLSVVNGILDMSKIESGNFEIAPELFSPAAAIAGCCDLLRLKASESGVGIRLRLSANLPDVLADKRALNQILINLISNAVKFSHRGGNVTVGALREGAYLVLTVEDTGVGVAREDLPRLGEVFFQARGSYDRRHDGSGLGLSIVKGLVQLHGGDIQITSRLGEGTRVVVRLPVDCEAKRGELVCLGRESGTKPTVEEAITSKVSEIQVKKRA